MRICHLPFRPLCRAEFHFSTLHALVLFLKNIGPAPLWPILPESSRVMTSARARWMDGTSSSGADSNHLCRARSHFFLRFAPAQGMAIAVPHPPNGGGLAADGEKFGRKSWPPSVHLEERPSAGWSVLRVWECRIGEERTLSRIMRAGCLMWAVTCKAHSF